jgi:hypothetical protein
MIIWARSDFQFVSKGWKSFIEGVLYFTIGVACVVVAANHLGYTKFDIPFIGAESSVASTWDTRASKVVEAMDYKNPTTRDYALIMVEEDHGGKYNIAQICDVWEKTYKRWTYVNDPKGFNYYSPASRTIKLGLKGDCDDFAILVASTMMAIGGSSRIILASNTDGAGHAYAEVRVASSKAGLDGVAAYICLRYHCKSISYRTSTDGGKTQYWLNLDWQAKHPGGPYYKNNGETVVIYPNGRWVKLK